MSAALGLLRLQQVDTQIDQSEDKLKRILAELADDTEAAAARRALETAQVDQEEAERNRLDAENQAAAQRHKLQQAESSLYGGSVRNPKELQDLQADVASLKRHLATLEETELAWMERLESAEVRAREAQATLDGVLSRAGVDHGRLESEQAELIRLRENLLAERSAAVNAVAPRLLETYDGLRRSRRGIAVAHVGDNACEACGTVLTAALQQSARHAVDLVFCPSCNRILYAD
jgi:predicted  nucleic acid-binding Zn-ribbon protein